MEPAPLAALDLNSFDLELAAVQAELRAAGPAYVPSAFWQWLSDVNTNQISGQDLVRFERTINNNDFQFLPGDMNDPQVRQLSTFCAAHPSPWPEEAARSAHRLARDVGIKSVFDYNPFTHPEYPHLYGLFVGNIYLTFSYADIPDRFAPAACAEGFRANVDIYQQKLWRQLEDEAAAPWFLGARFTAMDIYLAVMTRWRPGRPWFQSHCPRLHAIASAADLRPEFSEIWRRNFPAA